MRFVFLLRSQFFQCAFFSFIVFGTAAVEGKKQNEIKIKQKKEKKEVNG